MNVEIREDVVMRAKTTAIFRRQSLSTFVQNALLKALTTTSEEPK